MRSRDRKERRGKIETATEKTEREIHVYISGGDKSLLAGTVNRS